MAVEEELMRIAMDKGTKMKVQIRSRFSDSNDVNDDYVVSFKIIYL